MFWRATGLVGPSLCSGAWVTFKTTDPCCGPAGFRVQILSGQVYIAGEVIDWTWTQSRNRNVKLQLLDVAQHYRLPDVDFLLLTGDWPPEDRSGQSTGCPLQGPVFMQVGLCVVW